MADDITEIIDQMEDIDNKDIPKSFSRCSIIPSIDKTSPPQIETVGMHQISSDNVLVKVILRHKDADFMEAVIIKIPRNRFFKVPYGVETPIISIPYGE